MIFLKSADEIEKMRRSSAIVAEVLRAVAEQLKPGVTTLELDRMAESMILERGAKPAFKGYRGFKHTLCTSVNEELVHGIPGERVLNEGDIISVDCGAYLDGFYGDAAWTYPVGKVSDAAERIMAVGAESLRLAIEKMAPGNRLYDISAAVQRCAEDSGYSVVRDYVGHGIGRAMHEEPQLPNYGKAGTGMKLRPGLVIAVEPMINEGTWKVEVLSDGWTVITQDRKLCVHFEHTVAITDDGPVVLSV